MAKELDDEEASPSATSDDRKGLDFDGIPITFEWTNGEWCEIYLSQIHVALGIAAKSRNELEPALKILMAEGVAGEIVQSMILTRDHLKALVELIDVAVTRSFVVLEGMGFNPRKSSESGTESQIH